jgi:hypothetical protein
MADLLHSFGAHLRRWVRNRRDSVRQKVNIPCSVSVFEDRDLKPATARETLSGRTINMSNRGLGFLVPQIRIGHRYIAGENRTLRIMLELPTCQVESYAIAKHYERLAEPGIDRGYVVGASITRMSNADRQLLADYLGSLKER